MAEVPIDKGVAWFVLVGAFMCGFFTVGGFKSVGILFVHVLERYEASQSLTAWMMGLMSFGLAIYSPISAAIGIRYTYRVSVMMGGLALHLGFLLSTFAPNVYFVICVLGGFVGFGNGFLYTPSMIMVGQYFDRHRSIAMGIAAAGGSCGQLLIPLVIRFLLDHYGYQGCMLIYSGVVLNGVVAGALLRPQSFYERRVWKAHTSVRAAEGTGVTSQIAQTPSHSVNSLLFKRQIQDSLTSTPVNALNGSRHVVMLDDMEETILNSGPDVLDESADDVEDACRRVWHGSVDVVCVAGDEVIPSEQADGPSGPDDAAEKPPFGVHYSSTGSLQMVNVNPDRAKSASTQAVNDDDPARIEDLLHRQENPCLKSCSGCFRPFADLFDRVFLARRVFWIYVLAVCCANAGYIDQFIFIPPYAKEIGISKFQTAAILAASGVADLIGRVSGGVFNSLHLIKAHIFTSLTLFVTAISILVTLVFHSYISLMLHGIVLGLIGGMYISMVPIVLMQIVGLSTFPKAFAFTMLGVGITNLTFPSLFGKISDMRGSCTLSFILLNVLMIGSGLLFLLLPSVQKLDEKHQEAKQRKGNGC